jgi:L-alanine-DL-glutamate epimerase-like enolase superfamily enzyme
MKAVTMRRRARLSPGFAAQAAVSARRQSDLDITEIRHLSLREPVSGARYSLLRMKTRSGITGWGESAAERDGEIETRSARLGWASPPTTYAAIDFSAPLAAALDMALLDIVANSCNAPA